MEKKHAFLYTRGRVRAAVSMLSTHNQEHRILRLRPKLTHTSLYLCSCCCCRGGAAKSRPTLCNPMDCGQPGSTVHGISQVGTLECIAIPFSRGLLEPGIEPTSPSLAGRHAREHTFIYTRVHICASPGPVSYTYTCIHMCMTCASPGPHHIHIHAYMFFCDRLQTSK